ncbi:glycosyl transferase [Actinomycetales bacterium SN12]|nr:glycosyl transferase [Actinomycetales bacterium SN12]
MRVMVWMVHGGWMDGFLRGQHEYIVPFAGDEPPQLPAGVRAVPERALREEDVDVVVLQSMAELEAAERLLGRVPGRDIAAVFVEHNTPKQHPTEQRHPLADQDRIPVVHVTHFNRLVWDNGDAPTRVIEHGVPDPGPLYSGEVPALGVVINEPVRRWRVTGTDLLPRFAQVAPLHAFGIDSDLLPAALGLPEQRLRIVGDLPTGRMHAELATRRAYLHPFRWTSLGLALLEAMTMGMPVLALATTEASRAVPPEAGAISADPGELATMAAALLADPDEARIRGAHAREFALEHYGLQRFLSDWDTVLDEQHTMHLRRSRTGARAEHPDAPQPFPGGPSSQLEGVRG